jgi:hypothetical protein
VKKENTPVFDCRATPLAWPELLQTIPGTSAIYGGRMQRRPNRQFILTKVLCIDRNDSALASNYSQVMLIDLLIGSCMLWH